MTTPSGPANKGKGSKSAPKGSSAVKVSDRTLTGLVNVFKMLADESRMKILLCLAQDGEQHVSALCEYLHQSQPAVSHHLTLLRMAGLVGYRRDGKHNYYRVESGLMRDLLEQFFDDSGNGHKQITFDSFSLAFKSK